MYTLLQLRNYDVHVKCTCARFCIVHLHSNRSTYRDRFTCLRGGDVESMLFGDYNDECSRRIDRTVEPPGKCSRRPRPSEKRTVGYVSDNIQLTLKNFMMIDFSCYWMYGDSIGTIGSDTTDAKHRVRSGFYNSAKLYRYCFSLPSPNVALIAKCQ